jgi:hypothetical protein
MAQIQPPLHPAATEVTGAAAHAESTCLGRTCMKWSADGELTALDGQLVLERLMAVDPALGNALANGASNLG